MKPVLLATALAGLVLMLAPFALEQFGPPTRSGNHVLTVEQAFKVSHRRDGDTVLVDIKIAPDAYLYRHKLSISSQNLALGEWYLPAGEPYEDVYFGKSHVYRQHLALRLPLQGSTTGGEIMLGFQGCASGLCYPPQTLSLPVN